MLRPDAIFLSPAASEWLGVEIGDTVLVQVGLRDVALRVAGALRADGTGQRLAVMDIAGAQWLLDRQGRLTRIDVKLRAGADLADAQARIQALLPAGLYTERPDASVRSTARLTRAYRVNLNVLALVALFTGGLLVFSTQALTVVRRRAQLALLRVLGVTRGGVVALLLAEGAMLGVIGAAAGVALGYLLAYVGLRFVGPDLGAGYFRGITATPRLEPVALARVLHARRGGGDARQPDSGAGGCPHPAGARAQGRRRGARIRAPRLAVARQRADRGGCRCRPSSRP